MSQRHSQAEFRPSTCHVYERYQRDIRNQRFKLIEYHVNGIRNTHLVDLQNDPWETFNLALDNAYSETVTSLCVELQRFRDTRDDRDSVFRPNSLPTLNPLPLVPHT